MRLVRLVLPLALCALGAPAIPAAAALPRVVVADAAPSPRGTQWSPPSRVVQADVTFAPSHDARLRALLAAQQQLGSPWYHRYLPTGAFARLFGANRRDVQALRAYLKSFGIHAGPLQANRLTMTLRGSSSAFARAFASTLQTGHVAGHAFTVFTHAATLPAALASRVAGVSGLSRLVLAHHASVQGRATFTGAPVNSCANPATMASVYGALLPSQLSTLYGMKPLWATGNTGVGQTIAVYSLAPYGQNALASFLQCYGLTGETITTVTTSGASMRLSNANTADIEPNTDLEEAAVLAPGATLMNYLGPNNTLGPTQLYARIANDNLATIVTTSWGICEAQSDVLSETPIFQQMAAQGQTVFAAAGDSGSSDCFDPQSFNPASTAGLAVDDPAVQPDVTSVGGLSVQLAPTTVVPATTSVWNDGSGAGGGGFSSVVRRPTWQVAAGLSTTDAHAAYRAVPDLSVVADPSDGFAVTWSGSSDNNPTSWTSIGGTSIGAPIMAALASDAAQACGANTRLGLLNPRLYAMAAAGTGFDDVTTGSNDLLQMGGYSAGVGYDPASGLGTPDAATFASGLCVQQPSPTYSSATLSATTASLDASPVTLSVTVMNASNAPMAGVNVSVTGVVAGGKVTVTPLSTSTNAAGVQTFTIAANHPGTSTLTVAIGATTLATSTVTFTSPWQTSDATATMAKLGTITAGHSALSSTGVVVAARGSNAHVRVASATQGARDLTSTLTTMTSAVAPGVACSGIRCDVVVTAGARLDLALNVFGVLKIVDLSAANKTLPVPTGSPAILVSNTGDTIAYSTNKHTEELVTTSPTGKLLSAVNLSLVAGTGTVTGSPTLTMTPNGPLVLVTTTSSVVAVVPGTKWTSVDVLTSAFGAGHLTPKGDVVATSAAGVLTAASRTSVGDVLVVSTPLSTPTMWTGNDVRTKTAPAAIGVVSGATTSLLAVTPANALSLAVNGPSWRWMAWSDVAGFSVTATSLITGDVTLTLLNGTWWQWTL